jgi:hypothetical protein
VDERTGPRSFNVSLLKPAQFHSPIDMGGSVSLSREYHYVHYTEIIPNSDPRSFQFDAAKRRTSMPYQARHIPRGTNFPGMCQTKHSSRFVLAIKHQESGENILKARFVLGGHCDSVREDIVQNYKNIKHSSIRLLLALSSVFGFEVWSTYI